MSFEEEPHTVGDYLLYRLCQLSNIETHMFIRTIGKLVFFMLPLLKSYLVLSRWQIVILFHYFQDLSLIM